MEKRVNNGVGLYTCLHCGLKRTSEGHDGCIGTLPNVMNACCGHGRTSEAYIQFNHKDYKENPNKYRIAGQKALDFIAKSKPLIKLLGDDVEVNDLTAQQSLKIVLIHNEKLRKENVELNTSFNSLKIRLREFENLLMKKNKIIKNQNKNIRSLKNAFK